MHNVGYADFYTIYLYFGIYNLQMIVVAIDYESTNKEVAHRL